jgi:hypothetical protein
MASVSWFGARIACFVETLQLRKNAADLYLAVLRCLCNKAFKEEPIVLVFELR